MASFETALGIYPIIRSIVIVLPKYSFGSEHLFGHLIQDSIRDLINVGDFVVNVEDPKFRELDATVIDVYRHKPKWSSYTLSSGYVF